MQCRTIQHQLSVYLDGEIRFEEKRHIERHLETCSECRKALAEMQKAWNLLGVLPDARTALYLYTRISARLKTGQTPRFERWFDRVLFPVSATVIAVIGLWLGSVVGRNGDAIANAAKVEEPVVLSYMDHFGDFPTASLGDAYFNVDAQE